MIQRFSKMAVCMGLIFSASAFAGGLGRSQIAVARQALLQEIAKLSPYEGFREIENVQFTNYTFDQGFFLVQAKISYHESDETLQCEIQVDTDYNSETNTPSVIATKVPEELCKPLNE